MKQRTAADQDLLNRCRWILAQLTAAKTEDMDVRRHLGRARSSVELAVERLMEPGDEAA